MYCLGTMNKCSSLETRKRIKSNENKKKNKDRCRKWYRKQTENNRKDKQIQGSTFEISNIYP